MLREQYFSLMLDRDAALAAIPKMLPADAAQRKWLLDRHPPRLCSHGRGRRGERAQRPAQRWSALLEEPGRRSLRQAAARDEEVE